MNREEIKKILPHREPMLLVDEAAVTEDGKAEGSYTVRGDEFFLQGHFPGSPVVPGVILCEMMAQCCCVLLQSAMTGAAQSAQKEGVTGSSASESAREKAVMPYYTGLNNVKFRNPVKPGDTVHFKIELKRVKEPFYFAAGEGFVDGKRCINAEFSFALLER